MCQPRWIFTSPRSSFMLFFCRCTRSTGYEELAKEKVLTPSRVNRYEELSFSMSRIHLSFRHEKKWTKSMGDQLWMRIHKLPKKLNFLHSSQYRWCKCRLHKRETFSKRRWSAAAAVYIPLKAKFLRASFKRCQFLRNKSDTFSSQKRPKNASKKCMTLTLMQ